MATLPTGNGTFGTAGSGRVSGLLLSVAWLGTAIFCKLPQILPGKQSEGLGTDQGLLVLRIQLQQSSVFHVISFPSHHLFLLKGVFARQCPP